jgi:hypothetical protein
MLILSNSEEVKEYLEHADQHDDDQRARDAVFHKHGIGRRQRLWGRKNISSQEIAPRVFARTTKADGQVLKPR